MRLGELAEEEKGRRGKMGGGRGQWRGGRRGGERKEIKREEGLDNACGHTPTQLLPHSSPLPKLYPPTKKEKQKNRIK